MTGGSPAPWNYPSPWRGRQEPMIPVYNEMRSQCSALEELIEAGDFTEKELKRLDKAVTVMKVGFKMLKKVIKIWLRQQEEERKAA